MKLPGVCVVCRAPVVWNGHIWRAPGRGNVGRHVCRKDRPSCGAWMPQARERCARQPGHRWEHRTTYAMENARVRRAA